MVGILDRTGRLPAAAEALDERLAMIHRYWEELRADKPLPLRADLDPSEFFRAWPVVFMFEGSSLREMQVRFAGDAYYSLYGYEVTGRRVVDCIPGDTGAEVLEDYRTCQSVGRPVFRRGETDWVPGAPSLTYQRLVMPLGDERGQVTHLLGVSSVTRHDGIVVF